MEQNHSIQLRQERGRRMALLGFSFGFVSLIFAIAISIQVLGWEIGTWSKTYLLIVSPLICTTFYGFGAGLYGWLNLLAGKEREEQLLLEQRKNSRMLSEGESSVEGAGTASFLSYRRIAPRLFALLGIHGMMGFTAWIWWTQQSVKTTELDLIKTLPPDRLLAISGVGGLIILLIMAFCIGQSRERGFRWLRAVGSWFGVALLALILVTISCLLWMKFEWTGDRFFFLFYALLLGILYIEQVLLLILDFFRPRGSIEERPVFESRILGLFADPGDIWRNFSDAMEYQFGLSISREWIIRFIRYAFIPVIALWLTSWWLSTSIIEIKTGELGIREHLGKPVDNPPLTAGLYWNLPWPMGNLKTADTHQLRIMLIGPQLPEVPPAVVLWSRLHYQKDFSILIVDPLKQFEQTYSSQVPAVSLLNVSIPVQYRISATHIQDYFYNQINPEERFRIIAEKAIMEYFSSLHYEKIIADERQKISHELTLILQNLVQQEKLGLEIVSAHLHDAHPPVNEVAQAFEAVMDARENKTKIIEEAKRMASETITKSEIREKQSLVNAYAYREEKKRYAEVLKQEFNQQRLAFEACPIWYQTDAVLTLLESYQGRLYLISNQFDDPLYEINLEEATRFDLLNLEANDIKR